MLRNRLGIIQLQQLLVVLSNFDLSVTYIFISLYATFRYAPKICIKPFLYQRLLYRPRRLKNLKSPQNDKDETLKSEPRSRSVNPSRIKTKGLYASNIASQHFYI